MTVYVLIGLLGSGKSTWSNKKIQEDPLTIIVSRDNFRSMIRGNQYVFDSLYEPFIHEATYKTIEEALLSGFNVIIDECNLKRNNREELTRFLQSLGVADLNITYVVFKENTKNLSNRMASDARGISEQKWAEILAGMKNVYEPVSESEYYTELIEVQPF